jgi:hypothetical protein
MGMKGLGHPAREEWGQFVDEQKDRKYCHEEDDMNSSEPYEKSRGLLLEE